MNRTRRMTIWLVVLSLLLVTVIFHMWTRYQTAYGRALQAKEDLAASEYAIQRIQAIQDRPALASDREQLEAETTGRIEQAATEAGIRQESLAHINPQRPQRIGDSVYKHKPTQVLLRKVTLDQTVKMMHAFGGEDGLQPVSLRLSSPRRDDTGPLWDVELTLTYLIYAPPETK